MTDDHKDRVARNFRRTLWTSAGVGAVAAALFVVAIVTDLGRVAGVGGVLLAVAVVVAIAAAAYADFHDYWN